MENVLRWLGVYPGQGIGCVVRSPNGNVHELSGRLEFECTNNQVEYEALLMGLEFLIGMGVRDIKAYGDSKLVVDQLRGESQCMDGMLNAYVEKCSQLISCLDYFQIEHAPRENNQAANRLAQHASGYEVKHGRFYTREKPMTQSVNEIENGTREATPVGYADGDGDSRCLNASWSRERSKTERYIGNQ
jgi:ribonuclease HI